jgi:predicted ATPase
MINRIKIEGYKSIKSLDLELKPINILIGSNGVGKSNFLSFFKLVNNICEQRLQNFVGKQGGADNLLHFGVKITNQLIGNVFFDNRNSYRFNLQPNIENTFLIHDEGGFNSEYGFSFTYKDTWFYNVFTILSSESKINDVKGGIAKWVNNYLESLKIFHFHDTGEDSPLRSSCQINDNKFLRENGKNLSAFLYFLQEKHPKNFDRIQKTIKSIAPYFERFELSPDRLNESMIRLEWKEINQPDGYFNASHLSDGTLRFIALATLLMQPNLPEVIIIDEPELGLHPFAINKLAGLIRKASSISQIIISTQSVNFVDNFEPEEIVTVDRIGNESIFSRLKSEDLENWLSEYTIGDLWQKNVIKGQP